MERFVAPQISVGGGNRSLFPYIVAAAILTFVVVYINGYVILGLFSPSGAAAIELLAFSLVPNVALICADVFLVRTTFRKIRAINGELGDPFALQVALFSVLAFASLYADYDLLKSGIWMYRRFGWSLSSRMIWPSVVAVISGVMLAKLYRGSSPGT